MIELNKTQELSDGIRQLIAFEQNIDEMSALL